MRISIEDFLTLLEQELSSGASTEVPAEKPAAAFDYNKDLLYHLYENAVDNQDYDTAFRVLDHANTFKIQLSKELV